MKKVLSLIVILTLSITTFAKGDNKTVVYTTTPVMHCTSCENKIKSNLRFIKGIKSIVTDVEKQTVTIKFDNTKTTTENIEKGFMDIGYTVKKLSENKEQQKNNNTKNTKK